MPEGITMKSYLITFRSVTFAQKAQRALGKAGIDCHLIRTPKALSRKGCGYCLQFRPDKIRPAKQLLDDQGLDYGKCYGIRPDGGMDEVLL